MGRLKEGIDPLLEWAPLPIYGVVWAVVVFTVLLVTLSIVVRRALPWVGRLLQAPVESLLNGVGMLLVLPEYLTTSALVRTRRQVPNVVFVYGDAVQGAVSGTQRASRSSLAALTRLTQAPKKWLVLVLLLVFAGWDSSYCSGRDATCRMPTTEWADSVPTWVATWSDD